MKPCTFIPKPQKSKKKNFLPLVLKKFPICFQENSIYYILENGTLTFLAQALKIKDFSTLGKFIVLQKTETPQKILIFQETEFPYILSPNIKKFLIISGAFLFSQKMLYLILFSRVFLSEFSLSESSEKISTPSVKSF